MILLSSFERLKRILCLADNDNKSKARVTSLLYAVSTNIQAFLNNDLEAIERTEFYNILNKQVEFWVSASPVTSINTIEHDEDGLFDGSESTLTDFYIGKQARSVVIDFPETPGRKVLKIVYTGGAATSATISTYTLTSVVGTFIVNNFVTGSLSGAVGIIKVYTSSTEELQVDVLYGVFSAGETLTMQSTEGGADIGGISGVLSTIDNQSLVEKLPDVALACEMQIQYQNSVFGNFEATDIKQDETKRRANQDKLTFSNNYNDLQPETKSMLSKHVRWRVD